jgi:hypothetical protein
VTHGNDVGVAQKHVRHARVQNKVLLVSNNSENSWLNIGSSDNEGDKEGIGDRNSVK